MNHRKRSGGPQTAAGKARSSRNALKTGITVGYWLNADEQAEYDALLEALIDEYPTARATTMLLVSRLACSVVKLNRLQRIENARFEGARIIAGDVARQQLDAEHSLASCLPPTAEAREFARRVATESAMPDPEPMTTLARYQTALERQIIMTTAELRRIVLLGGPGATAPQSPAAKPAATPAASRLFGDAPDIEDVTPRSVNEK
jgi:hypothetical protein